MSSDSEVCCLEQKKLKFESIFEIHCALWFRKG